MDKPFKFILPDEPFKNTSNLNKAVDCIYFGPRYITLDVTNDTGICNSIEEGSDEQVEVGKKECKREGHSFITIDAWDNLIIAAYFTKSYKHENIPDYEENVPGGKFIFNYVQNTGIIEQLTFFGTIKYDFINKTFTGPEYRTSALSRESAFRGFLLNADNIRMCLDKKPDTFTLEEKNKLEEHEQWLRSLPQVYANIDHWKIPWVIKDLPPLPNLHD